MSIMVDVPPAMVEQTKAYEQAMAVLLEAFSNGDFMISYAGLE